MNISKDATRTILSLHLWNSCSAEGEEDKGREKGVWEGMATVLGDE